MTQRKIALSIEEAADYTGIGRNTLRKLVEWKKLHKKRFNLKKRFPKKPPKVLSDRSHDIPTRKQIIPCTSSDRQQETYVW